MGIYSSPPLTDFTKFVRNDKKDRHKIGRNRKLMRTDIFFARIAKPICNFVNPVLIRPPNL